MKFFQIILENIFIFKEMFEAFLKALAETERGFDYANGDFYRVEGYDGLWETQEVNFDHPDCKLPENNGMYFLYNEILFCFFY